MNFIDLGLPSNTKWADCNIGADNPQESGNYYAWGELLPKNIYSYETYKYPIYDNVFKNHKNDVATILYGDNCHIPTLKEWKELEQYCNFTLTNTGYKIISKINNNSIFLPFTGVMSDKMKLFKTTYGKYWLKSTHTNHFRGWCIRFSYLRLEISSDIKHYGLCIRPVFK